MRIEGDFIIQGTATIETLPISNSSLSAIVQADGNLFRRDLGTISTVSKESYIPGLSVAFPSIFNLNTESLDYNNRSLVVSLKNQLQGTAFLAPVSMNGTPAFRRIVKSDLTDANVVFTDDNTFVKKAGDTMTGTLTGRQLGGSWASGMWDRVGIRYDKPGSNVTYSGWLAQKTFNGGSWGLGNLGDNFYITHITPANLEAGNNVVSQMLRLTPEGRLDTIGHIYGVEHLSLWSNSTSNNRETILEMKRGASRDTAYGTSAWADMRMIFNNDLVIERKINNVTSQLLKIDNAGLITSLNHGTSLQWKQAVDWGNHRDFGYWNANNLRALAIASVDANVYFDDKSGGYVASYGSSGWLTNGAFFGYGGLIHYQGSSINMGLQMQYDIGHNTTAGGRLAFRTKHNGGYTNWKEVLHTGNFDVNGFVKKTGDVMSGLLDFSTATAMISSGGVTFLSKGQQGTILANNTLGSSSTVGVAIRPLGYSVGANQTLFSGDGFIRSSIHGDSSQWKQAYDWGNPEGRYLRTGDNRVFNSKSVAADLDLQRDSVIYATGANRPNNTNSTVLTLSGLSEYGFQIAGRNANIWFRGLEAGTYRDWYSFWHSGNLVNPATQSWVNSQNFKQTLALGTPHGEISISDGNTIVLNSLASRARLDANIRELGQAFTPYLTSGGLSTNYPVNSSNGTGIRMERYSGPASQLGFDIYKAANQDYLWIKTFDGSNTENSWKILADRTWVNSQGFSTQTLIAGTNVQINGSTISAINTTYSAGTLALLNTGTDTAIRVWRTIDISDFVTNKLAQGADSLWEHTPQGGLRIRNYNSLATRDGAIAITKGGGATKYNAIGIGTSVNSDGNDGLAIGPLSANLGAYGTVVGPYSTNTPMEGTVVGAFLLNNQRGCTVTGRYNHPILNTTTNTINDDSPLFIIGNGKDASIRSNAYVMKSNGKGEFANIQFYKEQHSFGDMDIPNWKFIRDNISGGGTGAGAEDYVSEYGSGISVFHKGKASEELVNSPYSASGEILSNQDLRNVTKPTLVYLGTDGAWRKWNDTNDAEQSRLNSTAFLGISLPDNKSVLLKGYYLGQNSAELSSLVGEIDNGNRFHSINKGSLLAYNSTGGVERTFGYSINNKIAYFNPWAF
ncbi:hypothetical protein [Myroides odoratus]|uniref:hypothetical protein n=1 Tax=Myroides odoratus TaxID=256 RepID=UPI0039B0B73F